MMKLLMGGSPCTHWSIAQTKNRETEPSGLGWELFENYLIALRKYKPDYFLYENNKSMSPAIRAQITKELGVEPILINSALVSAQNRQRLYWTNIPGVTQPEDKGILLRDVLESGAVSDKEKAYTLRASAGTKQGTSNILRHIESRGQFGYQGCFEPISILNVNPSGHGMNGAVMHINGKSRTLTTNKGEGPKIIEPVRIGTIESNAKNADFDSQQYRVYSPDGKSVTLCGNGGGVGAKTGLYAVPVAGRIVGRRINEQGHRDDYNPELEHVQRFEVNDDPQKTNCLTTVQKDNMVAVPCKEEKVGIYPNGKGELTQCQSKRIYGIDAKGRVLNAGPGGLGVQTGLYAMPPDGKTHPVYEVHNGLITIKGKQYPIKLPDGYYIIRKLTVTECKRLQTVPDSYIFPVSASQAYKMLGNGWTVDVIAHILSHAPGITTEPIEVLSMYDGMSCGHIAMDKLGANVVRYYATEIDKYAMQTTMTNYHDTVQLGDAFQVREDGWAL